MPLDPRLVALGLTSPAPEPIVTVPTASAPIATEPIAAEPIASAQAGHAPIASAPTPYLPTKARIEAAAVTWYPSGSALLRFAIRLGFPSRSAELALEPGGFSIDAKRPIAAAWGEVRSVAARRGQVRIGTPREVVAFAATVDGVAEPALAIPLARLIEEARIGRIDVAGTVITDMRNVADSLRDRFNDEDDDTLIPLLVGIVFGLSTLAFLPVVPYAMLVGTTEPYGGAFVIDPPIATTDPAIAVIALGAAALLAALTVRVALGRHALAWARGTLRGWHPARNRLAAAARRMLAAMVHRPALAAAALLLGIALAADARTQVLVDPAGVHVLRELPALDEHRPWRSVTEVALVTVPLSDRHPAGIAVAIRWADRPDVTTIDHSLRGGSTRQLFERAAAWRAAAWGTSAAAVAPPE